MTSNRACLSLVNPINSNDRRVLFSRLLQRHHALLTHLSLITVVVAAKRNDIHCRLTARIIRVLEHSTTSFHTSILSTSASNSFINLSAITNVASITPYKALSRIFSRPPLFFSQTTSILYGSAPIFMHSKPYLHITGPSDDTASVIAGSLPHTSQPPPIGAEGTGATRFGTVNATWSLS